MNLEHVVRALDEQNKIAAEILEIMKGQEERNARGEARAIQMHVVAIEAAQLTIEREKVMARDYAERAAVLSGLRNGLQAEIVFPDTEKKETN